MIKDKAEEARRAMQERTREHKREVKAMKQRVKQRPLLLEREKHEQRRMRARKKALFAIKESLDKAGIKDYRQYFDKVSYA